MPILKILNNSCCSLEVYTIGRMELKAGLRLSVNNSDLVNRGAYFLSSLNNLGLLSNDSLPNNKSQTSKLSMLRQVPLNRQHILT